MTELLNGHVLMLFLPAGLFAAHQNVTGDQSGNDGGFLPIAAFEVDGGNGRRHDNDNHPDAGDQNFLLIAPPVAVLYALANPQRMQEQKRQTIESRDQCADNQALFGRAEIIKSGQHNYRILRLIIYCFCLNIAAKGEDCKKNIKFSKKMLAKFFAYGIKYLVLTMRA